MIKIEIHWKKIFSFIQKMVKNVYVHILLLLSICAYMIYSMFNVEIVKTEIPEKTYKTQKNIYILDAGHGYDERNKCSNKAYFVEQGDSCFYEYKFNIRVLEKLKTLLDEKNIFYLTTDSLYHKRDLSVNQRAKFVNSVYKQVHEKDIVPVLFSIHANASTKNLNARGMELFTNTKKMPKMFKDHTRAIQNQIQLMNVLADNLKIELPNQLFREKRDRVYKYSYETHEGGVKILDATKAYTALIEAGFYTNDDDRKLLSSDEYQNKIANAIFKTICAIEGIEPKKY